MLPKHLPRFKRNREQKVPQHVKDNVQKALMHMYSEWGYVSIRDLFAFMNSDIKGELSSKDKEAYRDMEQATKESICKAFDNCKVMNSDIESIPFQYIFNADENYDNDNANANADEKSGDDIEMDLQDIWLYPHIFTE
eukprot:Nk52_evm19s316 gene=Nk52_evmTU19s316